MNTSELRAMARPIVTILVGFTLCVIAVASTIGYSAPEWFLGLGGTIVLSEFGLRTFEKSKNITGN